jgi:23S rRNA pseudouridine1911/1915/1917 synthase
MDEAAQGPEGPRLIAETGDFAVVYKPPRLHCAPLLPGEGGTLLEWYAGLFPPVMEMRGRKPLEGGLLHRLDYETQGLVLFGKTQAALEALWAQQEAGRFVKEYGAVVITENFSPPLPGFPPPPFSELPGPGPFFIQSYFRPYGPGRKAVRPVAEINKTGKEIASDQGRPYETEVVEITGLGKGRRYAALRIRRGFRHQIRCHLAWLGNPICRDPLYGEGGMESGPLALCAQGLFFFDPQTGAPREYRIPSLKECWDSPL